MSSRSKTPTLLWALALLVAVANCLVVVWRLPIQKRLAQDADEKAVQDAARWIAPLATDARLLLLVSSQDPTNFHFSTRLIYFLYPHRIDIAANALPPEARLHYNGILAFGRMAPVLDAWRKQQASGWRLQGRDQRALLLVSPHVSAATPASQHLFSLPGSTGLLCGLFSMLMLIVLGAQWMVLFLRAPPFGMWWANLALAHLLGSAVFAIVEHGCVLVSGKPLVWPVYALVAGLAMPAWKQRATGLAILYGDSSRREPQETSAGHPGEGYSNRLIKSRSAPIACLALALGVFTVLERVWLIGLDWDAFAIWQLKAKMLFLDGNLTAWRDTTQFPYAHFDYPLLPPFLTWWTYQHYGGINLRWAQAHGFLFYADLLAIFCASALHYVPREHALGATALLAGLPEVTLHAVSGYADLPVAVYFLGAGVFLVRALVDREQAAWPLAGGMLAGVILTKNEGLLACVAAFVVAVGYSLRVHRAGTDEMARREHAGLGWLLTPVLAYLPWLLLKRKWQLANDVIQAAHPPHFTPRLLWWRMWYAVVFGFGKQMAWLGPWFPAWGLFGVVVLIGCVLSCRCRAADAAPLWLLAGLQLCGYVGIYMITPAALPAHILSSVDRLLLHVAPTLLLATLLSCFQEDP